MVWHTVVRPNLRSDEGAAFCWGVRMETGKTVRSLVPGHKGHAPCHRSCYGPTTEPGSALQTAHPH